MACVVLALGMAALPAVIHDLPVQVVFPNAAMMILQSRMSVGYMAVVPRRKVLASPLSPLAPTPPPAGIQVLRSSAFGRGMGGGV